MSLFTGTQLKADRSLFSINQSALVEPAGVNMNTVRILQNPGIAILCHSRMGVRIRKLGDAGES
jgi:hypothetical protein